MTSTQSTSQKRKIVASSFYMLTVSEDETGRVIGKDGKVANAMRVLLRVASNKQGDHTALKIM